MQRTMSRRPALPSRSRSCGPTNWPGRPDLPNL